MDFVRNRSYIVIIFTAVLLSVAFFIGWNIWQPQNLEGPKQEYLALAEQRALQAGSELRYLSSVTKMLAEAPQWRWQEVARSALRIDDVRGVYFVRGKDAMSFWREDRRIASTPWQGAGNESTRPNWYRLMEREGRPHIFRHASFVVPNQPEQENIFGIFLPVIEKGEMTGVAGCLVISSELTRAMAKNGRAQNVFLVAPDGSITIRDGLDNGDLFSEDKCLGLTGDKATPKGLKDLLSSASAGLTAGGVHVGFSQGSAAAEDSGGNSVRGASAGLTTDGVRVGLSQGSAAVEDSGGNSGLGASAGLTTDGVRAGLSQGSAAVEDSGGSSGPGEEDYEYVGAGSAAGKVFSLNDPAFSGGGAEICFLPKIDIGLGDNWYLYSAYALPPVLTTHFVYRTIVDIWSVAIVALFCLAGWHWTNRIGNEHCSLELAAHKHPDAEIDLLRLEKRRLLVSTVTALAFCPVLYLMTSIKHGYVDAFTKGDAIAARAALQRMIPLCLLACLLGSSVVLIFVRLII